jgi:hypothetical protein
MTYTSTPTPEAPAIEDVQGRSDPRRISGDDVVIKDTPAEMVKRLEVASSHIDTRFPYFSGMPSLVTSGRSLKGYEIGLAGDIDRGEARTPHPLTPTTRGIP